MDVFFKMTLIIAMEVLCTAELFIWAYRIDWNVNIKNNYTLLQLITAHCDKNVYIYRSFIFQLTK